MSMIIQNAMIHVGNGREPFIGSVAVKHGIIEQVVEGSLPGEERDILEAEGKHLYPGFIQPCTVLGSQNVTFRQPDTDESSYPLTPLSDVYYAFNPSELAMENIPSVGVTTLGSAPGSANILGGRMAAFHTSGTNPGKMLISRNIGVRGAVGRSVKEVYGTKNEKPMTRMGIFALLKAYFEQEQASKPEEAVRQSILSGKTPLFLDTRNYQDMASTLTFFEAYPKVRLVFVGCFEFAHMLDELVEKRIPLIFSDQIYLSHASYADIDLALVEKFLRADIPVSFTSDSPHGASGRVHYFWNLARFIEAGLAKEDVLKIMTLNPARILGLEDRIGSIEEGKWADLVLTNEDYLAYYSAQIEWTMIKGNIVYRSEQKEVGHAN